MQKTTVPGTQFGFICAFVAIAALSVGCANRVALVTPGPAGYVDDRAEIQMVSTHIQGKNVYIPATVILTAGRETTLSIYNTTDTPHGFRITGLGIEAILHNGKENKVVIPPLRSGAVYLIDCQLHPPHRHATLVVLPHE